MLVSEAMTRRAEMIGPDESLEDAARRMRDVGVGALAVSVDGETIGVITDRDLVVRGIAAGVDLGTATVRSVMTPVVIECAEDEPLGVAATHMEEGAVRRALVVNARHDVVGMLSVDDVALHDTALAGEILAKAREPGRPVHRGPWPWWE